MQSLMAFLSQGAVRSECRASRAKRFAPSQARTHATLFAYVSGRSALVQMQYLPGFEGRGPKRLAADG
jgi:hypothetical protein